MRVATSRIFKSQKYSKSFKSSRTKSKVRVATRFDVCAPITEEYTSVEFTIYLKKAGIRRQLTCPCTPQHNGVPKRKNQHLVETVRIMMQAKNVPEEFGPSV